ncbi:hypothetical protein C3L33_12722, partial [Rhododendron williamsianum]
MSGTLRLQTEFENRYLYPSKVGAGILYKKGYILTNAHVVSDSFEVPSGSTRVKHWVVGKVVANFYGGVQCDAEVLSVNVGKDVALLKIPESVIKPSNIPCVFSKDVPGRGDKVFVVGHPHGVPFNVKYGHVSNPSRPLSDIRAFVQNGFPHSFEYMDPDMTFLEIDVTAAKGSSGGPISTAEGSVFGVLHAGIEGTACYGIPVAIIKRAVRRMLNRSRSPGYDVFCHLN